jgi:hypothetical protein
MPKLSGESMKTLRVAPPAAPKARIVRFDPPAGSKVDPMLPGAPKQADQLKPAEKPSGGSNAIAAHAVRVASTPGKIDGRQQHY